MPDSFRDPVLFASNLLDTRLLVLKHVVISMKQLLCLSHSGIEMEPALTARVPHAVTTNASRDDPVADSFDGIFGGRECLSNFVGRLVLAPVGRVRR